MCPELRYTSFLCENMTQYDPPARPATPRRRVRPWRRVLIGPTGERSSRDFRTRPCSFAVPCIVRSCSNHPTTKNVTFWQKNPRRAQDSPPLFPLTDVASDAVTFPLRFRPRRLQSDSSGSHREGCSCRQKRWVLFAVDMCAENWILFGDVAGSVRRSLYIDLECGWFINVWVVW